jgi:hypothetical protein
MKKDQQTSCTPLQQLSLGCKKTSRSH